jgi:hypothetical protein
MHRQYLSLIALIAALKHIYNKGYRRTVVLSDSFSALQTLQTYQTNRPDLLNTILTLLHTDPETCYYTSCTVRNGTLSARYGTLSARYETLSARYETLLARYETLLARNGTLLARYETLLARYGTLCTKRFMI